MSRFLWRIQVDKTVACSHNERSVSVIELRKLAIEYQIPGRRSMNKVELARAIQAHFAAHRIAIAWLAFKKTKTEPVEQSESLDPITLEPPESPCFVFHRGGGKQTKYTARVLIDYLLASNNFREPVSNLPLTDAHLRELDEIAKEHSWPVESVLQRKHSAVPDQKKVEQEVYNVIEVELLDVAGKMRDCLASQADSHDVSRRLRFRLMPEFVLLYGELRHRDSRAAENSVLSAISLLNAQLPIHLMLSHTVIANLYALLP